MSAPCSIQLAGLDGIRALDCSNSFPACQSFGRSLLGLSRRLSISGSWSLVIEGQFFHDDLLLFHGWLTVSRSVKSKAEEENVF